MSTSYLVNIVANDFKDGSGIFDPFLLDQDVSSSTGSLINGIKSSVKAAANGIASGIANGVNGH